MRILTFTDVHGHPATLKMLAKKARNVDFCICCGDFTTFSIDMDWVIDFFGRNFPVPVYMIHGNHDSYRRFLELCKHYQNIIPFHLKLLKLKKHDICMFGFGGGGFSFTEPVLEKAHKELKKKLPPGERLILVTHAPAYHTSVDFLDEQRGHRGCNSSRKIIEDLQPMLALSGHFHETFGVDDKIGKSLLLNPGDEGIIIEVNDGKIKLKKK